MDRAEFQRDYINEWDDSTDSPAPCQPIGCDAGFHLARCIFDTEEDEEPDDTCRCGHPECGAC